MPIAAQCPNCGRPLDDISVASLAPICEGCGTVIVKIGGTLGLTSAYGVNDPTITRDQVEAALAVFCDHKKKSVGMLEACKEELNWGVERYAKLPNPPGPPELLPLVEVGPFWKNFLGGLWAGVILSICILVVGFIPIVILLALCESISRHLPLWAQIIVCIYDFLILFAWIVPLTMALWPHYEAKAANGDRPLENARRQKAYKDAFAAYEAACAAALKAAEPVKAAQDHRLSCKIRDLDGRIETLTEKAEDFRKILRTL